MVFQIKVNVGYRFCGCLETAQSADFFLFSQPYLYYLIKLFILMSFLSVPSVFIFTFLVFFLDLVSLFPQLVTYMETTLNSSSGPIQLNSPHSKSACENPQENCPQPSNQLILSRLLEPLSIFKGPLPQLQGRIKHCYMAHYSLKRFTNSSRELI